MFIAVLLTMLSSTETGPLDFRCDTLRVDSKAGQSLCTGNVVVIRGSVLMCCDQFEAHADQDWQWKSFSCRGNVKAQRFSERVWATEATFNLNDSVITLRGRPVLQRGRSLMTGTKVSIDLKSDNARITSPRGRVSKDAQTASPYPPVVKLVDKCPLPDTPEF